MRILLVEDDEPLGDGLQTGLAEYQHTVDWVRDGLLAKQALATEKFDVVILDLGLPKLSGLDVLKTLRKENNDTPVLILTARDEIDDRVLGLDAGADDYLTKPCDLDELEARVRALHRRRSGITSNVISRGELSMDCIAHQVVFKGKTVSLPRREFSILQRLLENQDRVISRDNLMQALYGWEEEVDSNTVEVHIHNLRKKFGNNLVRTVRGIGYMTEKIEKAEKADEAG